MRKTCFSHGLLLATAVALLLTGSCGQLRSLPFRGDSTQTDGNEPPATGTRATVSPKLVDRWNEVEQAVGDFEARYENEIEPHLDKAAAGEQLTEPLDGFEILRETLREKYDEIYPRNLNPGGIVPQDEAIFLFEMPTELQAKVVEVHKFILSLEKVLWPLKSISQEPSPAGLEAALVAIGLNEAEIDEKLGSSGGTYSEDIHTEVQSYIDEQLLQLEGKIAKVASDFRGDYLVVTEEKAEFDRDLLEQFQERLEAFVTAYEEDLKPQLLDSRGVGDTLKLSSLSLLRSAYGEVLRESVENGDALSMETQSAIQQFGKTLVEIEKVLRPVDASSESENSKISRVQKIIGAGLSGENYSPGAAARIIQYLDTRVSQLQKSSLTSLVSLSSGAEPELEESGRVHREEIAELRENVAVLKSNGFNNGLLSAGMGLFGVLVGIVVGSQLAVRGVKRGSSGKENGPGRLPAPASSEDSALGHALLERSRGSKQPTTAGSGMEAPSNQSQVEVTVRKLPNNLDAVREELTALRDRLDILEPLLESRSQASIDGLAAIGKQIKVLETKLANLPRVSPQDPKTVSDRLDKRLQDLTESMDGTDKRLEILEARSIPPELEALTEEAARKLEAYLFTYNNGDRDAVKGLFAAICDEYEPTADDCFEKVSRNKGSFWLFIPETDRPRTGWLIPKPPIGSAVPRAYVKEGAGDRPIVLEAAKVYRDPNIHRPDVWQLETKGRLG